MSCSLNQIPAVLALLALTVLVLPIYGQINTPCTASMLNSLTPCLAFIANSTAGNNGTSSSPTSTCCSSLKTLTGSSMGCACLVLTGNVPFQVPINRTLAISLPSACNMPGVPLQCLVSVSPAPAPALEPASFGPTYSPTYAPGPVVSSTPTVTPLAPQSDTSTQDSVPTSPSVDTNTDTPQPDDSAAIPSFSMSSYLMLFASGVLVVSYY